MGKKKRITLDLTPEAAAEVERITVTEGLTMSEVFRHSLTLLRVYLEERNNGNEMRIVDPERPRNQVRILIPTHR